AERVGERRRLEAVVEEVHAVVTDLVPRGGRLQVLEVRVRERVAGDLVPGGVEVAELRPAQVGRVAGEAGVDVEGRVHSVRVQDRERAVLVGGAVVELDRDHRRGGGGVHGGRGPARGRGDERRGRCESEAEGEDHGITCEVVGTL